MDIDLINRLKITAIQALVSNDYLFDKLVLKGGNALDLIHKIAERASFDLDFSIEDSFDEFELPKIRSIIEELLKNSFKDKGYYVFDVTLNKRPNNIAPNLDDFWGGYKIEFKLLEYNKYEKLKIDEEKVRRFALPIGHNNSTKLRIEISRFEYIKSSTQIDVGGYMVKVYSPTLIAIEKLRAICQQTNEYRDIVNSISIRPRARDFFDIHTIITNCHIDLSTEESKTLLRCVFMAKRVPLNFLLLIINYRDFHSNDFVSVKDTVKPNTNLRSFDFYFDFVLDICKKLQS